MPPVFAARACCRTVFFEPGSADFQRIETSPQKRDHFRRFLRPTQVTRRRAGTTEFFLVWPDAFSLEGSNEGVQTMVNQFQSLSRKAQAKAANVSRETLQQKLVEQKAELERSVLATVR